MEKRDKERRQHEETEASTQKALLELLAKVRDMCKCVQVCVFHCCMRILTVMFIHCNRLLVFKSPKIE